uniref:ATP synthase complex subunit 8 n=1 Tax=Pseudoniphargus stocki TaxID=2211535 RepID=A0A345K5S9_9CRUS|nr:ATP synthase F0 subunit 8 [Pseudoniphargus stocki]AXH38221.1 ATP synthase F0 subunit 8 [Pseudoniphargus stocki]
MPQMAPILWFILFFSLLLLIYFFNFLFIFYLISRPPKKINKQNFKFNLNWKW